MQRSLYTYQVDQSPGHPLFEGDLSFALPPNAAMLPPEEAFDLEKKARLLLHKTSLKIRTPFYLGSRKAHRLESDRDYVGSLGGMRRPHSVRTWDSDEAFGQQRLSGTNPMAIEHCASLPDGDLGTAADGVLSTLYKTTLQKSHARIFRTNYGNILDPRVQSQVAHGACLAAAECIFYVTDYDALMPIAIELRNRDRASCVVTPLDRRPVWLLAKAHANSADSHYHEGISHLLETHMVSEVFKLATCRHLHPDHPLHQLLDPHFEHNLAIDHLARGHLLSTGGPIDMTMAAGVGGTLDLARIHWKNWSFKNRRFKKELEVRGVDDVKTIRTFPYRDDGLLLHHAIGSYARGVLRIWYQTDADVAEDSELRAWSKELSTHIPDFPHTIATADELCSVVAEIIFRASVQHSAVNNGQFDTYGFVPNSPGTLYTDIPRAELSGGLEEIDVMRAMPRLKDTLAQLGMSWVLSQPTHRSLYASGECPAFSAELCLPAYEEVQAFREQLRQITAAIETRNRSLSMPYTYLNPHNIGRSTGI